MLIELHSPGVRLHRAQSLMLLARVRQVFAHAAREVARIVLRIREDGRPATERTCELEVHLADGRVAVVQERHRRIAPLVERAAHRAWRAASLHESPGHGR